MQVENILADLEKSKSASAPKVREECVTRLSHTLTSVAASHLAPLLLSALSLFEGDTHAPVRARLLSCVLVAVSREPRLLLQEPRLLTYVTACVASPAAPLVTRFALEASLQLFPHALGLVVMHPPSQETRQLFALLQRLKDATIELLSRSPADSLQCLAIKFMELLVVLFTQDMPARHPVLKPETLVQEAQGYTAFLTSHLGGAHIGSFVGTSLISVLSSLAAARPQFTNDILSSLLAFQQSPPSSIRRSALKSVRKALQLALVRLLHLGDAVAARRQEIINAITALGGSAQLQKFLRLERRGKRGRGDLGDEDEDSDESPELKRTMHIEQAQVEEEEAPNALMALLTQVQATLPAAPSNIQMLDPSVLRPVEDALRSLQPEQLADLLILNLNNLHLVQADYSGDLSRDPRVRAARQARLAAIAGPEVKEVARTQSGLAVPQLSEDDLRSLWEATLMRIINAEHMHTRNGAYGQLLQRAVISRLMRGLPLEDRLPRRLLLHISADFAQRWQLALAWLFQELASGDEKQPVPDVEMAGEPEGDEGVRYRYLMMSIIDSILETVDTLEASLRFFLQQAPVLPPALLRLLGRFACDPDRARVGASVLASLAEQRHYYQDSAVSSLLSGCFCESRIARRACVQQTTALYLNSSACAPVIFKAATNAMEKAMQQEELQRTIELPPVEDEDDEDARQAQEDARRAMMHQQDVIHQALDMPCSLLQTEIRFLKPLAAVYRSGGPALRKECARMVCDAIGTLVDAASDLSMLIDELSTFPEDPETDALFGQVLVAITDHKSATAPLIKLVKARYQRAKDVRLLLPILRVISQREVTEAIPGFMALPRDELVTFIQRAAAHPYFAQRPVELAVQLHVCRPEGAKSDKEVMRVQAEAIDICLAHSSFSGDDTCAVLIKRLVETEPMPVLTMRTIMVILRRHAQLLSWVCNSTIPQMIKAQAWQQPFLWKGVVRFAFKHSKGCAPALLAMPQEQLEQMLGDKEIRAKLLPAMQGYLKKHRKRGSKQLRSYLDDLQRQVEEEQAAAATAAAEEEVVQVELE